LAADDRHEPDWVKLLTLKAGTEAADENVPPRRTVERDDEPSPSAICSSSAGGTVVLAATTLVAS
jgi:hypothetical protein